MKTTMMFAVVLLAGFVGTFAFAAPNQSCPQAKDCSKTFVDANNDGVCDNAGTACPRSEGCAQGSNFVDQNGDGVCDNAADGKCTKKGKGRNFVDANNDGVCDNAAAGQCAGKGKGQGKGQCDGQGGGQQNRKGSGR